MSASDRIAALIERLDGITEQLRTNVGSNVGSNVESNVGSNVGSEAQQQRGGGKGAARTRRRAPSLTGVPTMHRLMREHALDPAQSPQTRRRAKKLYKMFGGGDASEDAARDSCIRPVHRLLAECHELQRRVQSQREAAARTQRARGTQRALHTAPTVKKWTRRHKKKRATHKVTAAAKK